MNQWDHYVVFNGHPWDEIRARVAERLKKAWAGWSFTPSSEDVDEALTEARLDLAHYWQKLPSSQFDPEDPKRSFHFAVKRATHTATGWLWDNHDYRTCGYRRPPSERPAVEAKRKATENPYEGQVRGPLTDDEWNTLHPAALGWQAEPTPPRPREPEYKTWWQREQERVVRVLVDNALEPDERTVILALYWEGLSLQEAAPLVGKEHHMSVARLRDKALDRLRWWLGAESVRRFVVNRVKPSSCRPEGRPEPGGRPRQVGASRPRKGRRQASHPAPAPSRSRSRQ